VISSAIPDKVKLMLNGDNPVDQEEPLDAIYVWDGLELEQIGIGILRRLPFENDRKSKVRGS